MNGQIAFEADTFIPLEIAKLKKKFKIKNCVETGTQYGSTTISFSEMFDVVHTIEADEKYFEQAKEKLKELINVTMWLGKSEAILGRVDLREPTLFYLDAHGCEIGGCPLKQELEIIAKMNLTSVCIAIHDFLVPGKDFGFDAYDYELKFEEIETYLHSIYQKGFKYHYNTEADGAYRGIIFIYPAK